MRPLLQSVYITHHKSTLQRKSVCHSLVWSCNADLGDLLSQRLTHENADVLGAWGSAPAPVPRVHAAEMMSWPAWASH